MSLSQGTCLSQSSASKSLPSSNHYAGFFSPIGLHVLVVDDDPLCLLVLERMLKQCDYKVTTCNRVRPALQLLRENKDEFDLVISDVYMPDEDGFKLLEVIGLELDLPVIMMSANGETSVVMQGITHGACDYLIKPIRMEELRNIWQHVVRRRGREVQSNTVQGELDEAARGAESQDQSSKKRKDLIEMEDSSMDCLGGLKKARVNWSIELHRQFVDAVNQLGVDKAVPKRILEIMNVKGLTRENVASHLQKYRLYLNRLSGVVPERCPIASFQALDDGTSGGSMKIGKARLSNAGVKGRNLGAGIGGGVGGEKKVDVGTLESLAKYKLHQQKHAANRAQVLGGLGFADPKVSMEGGGLQRLCSLDLSFLLQAQGAGQSMDAVDDLAACSFRTVKLEDDTSGVSISQGNNRRTFSSRKCSTAEGHTGQWVASINLNDASNNHNDEQRYMHGGAGECNVGESSGFDTGPDIILGYADGNDGFINDMDRSASGSRGIGGNEGTHIGNMALMMENRRPSILMNAIQQEQRVGGMYAGIVSHTAYTLSPADLTDDAVSSTNVELSSLSTGTDVSGDAFSESSFSALAQLGGMVSRLQLPASSELMQCAELDISDYLEADDGFGFQC